MRTLAKFFKDTGLYGGGSVILSILLFAVTIFEHSKNHNVAAFWLGVLAVVFFCGGSFVAWNKESKKAINLEERIYDGRPILVLKVFRVGGRRDDAPPIWTFGMENCGTRPARWIRIKSI